MTSDAAIQANRTRKLRDVSRAIDAIDAYQHEGKDQARWRALTFLSRYGSRYAGLAGPHATSDLMARACGFDVVSADDGTLLRDKGINVALGLEVIRARVEATGARFHAGDLADVLEDRDVVFFDAMGPLTDESPSGRFIRLHIAPSTVRAFAVTALLGRADGLKGASVQSYVAAARAALSVCAPDFRLLEGGPFVYREDGRPSVAVFFLRRRGADRAEQATAAERAYAAWNQRQRRSKESTDDRADRRARENARARERYATDAAYRARKRERKLTPEAYEKRKSRKRRDMLPAHQYEKKLAYMRNYHARRRASSLLLADTPNARAREAA